VKLIVHDGDDGLDSTAASHSVTIVNLPPTAQFTVSPSSPLTGQTVTFSGAGSSDPDGSIVDYLWDLDGDGNFETDTGSTPTVTHVYPVSTIVTVALQVRDADGATATASGPISILPAPAGGSGGGPGGPNGVQGQQLELTINVPGGKGLRVRLSCNRPCTVSVRLAIAKKLAKRLRLKSATVAFGELTLTSTDPGTVTVKFTKPARKALAKLAKLAATVRATALDNAGNKVGLVRNLTLKR
jgi:hypothetical protein